MENIKRLYSGPIIIALCGLMFPFMVLGNNPTNLKLLQRPVATINLNKEKKITLVLCDNKENPMAEAKLIKNDQAISKVKFRSVCTPEDHYEISGKDLGDKGFTGHPQIISFKFAKNACDYINGEVLLIVKDNKLLYGAEAYSSSTEEMEGSYQCIFPKDKNGKPDHLIIISTFAPIKMHGSFGSPDYKAAEHLKDIYHWNGIKMIKIKEST